MALADPDTLSFKLNLLIIMPLFKEIIEIFKVTGEFAGNALSRPLKKFGKELGSKGPRVCSQGN